MKQVVYFLIYTIIGWGCESPRSISSPTYSGSLLSAGYSSFEIVATPEGSRLNEGWEVNSYDTTGGVNTDLKSFQVWEQTTLPHRILKPNSAIWYRKSVSHDDGVLQVSADDGAQVWLGDSRCASIGGEYFEVTESEDSLYLVIRVLNNAMEGGLRGVKFIPDIEWENHLRSKDSLTDLQLQRRKRALFIADSITELEAYPIFITDPVWQKSPSGQLMVRWVSERQGSASIHWGYDSSALEQKVLVESGNKVFQTAFPDPESNFYYQIRQEKTISNLYHHKLAMDDSTTTFTVWGDSQGGWLVFQQLVKLMNGHQPSFSVGAGDLVAYGHDKLSYKILLQSLSLANFHHYLVPGNHDYDGYYEQLQPENYFNYLGLPGQKQYFSWTEGNCAFIALDPNLTFPIGVEGDQLSWFLDQLDQPFWVEASWRFVIVHQPPFGQGWPGYHGEESILELLEPLFESAKIDAVIAGHNHNYERLIRQYGDQTVAFLVVGGGGGGMEPSGLSEWPQMDTVITQHHYGLVETSDKQLVFKTFNLENTLIDQFTLNH